MCMWRDLGRFENKEVKKNIVWTPEREEKRRKNE